MKQKKSAVPGWSLIGCGIVLLLVAVLSVGWFISAFIKGSWLARGTVLGAGLLYLVVLGRRVWARRLMRHRYSPGGQLETEVTELPEIENLRRMLASPDAILSFASDVVYFRRYFSDDEVATMLANGTAVDGNGGGLLLGRWHSEGGVPVLMNSVGGGYELKAEFEGYEYILNPGVLTCFPQECEAINQPTLDKQPVFEEYTPAAEITLLDVRTISHPVGTKYLILDGSTSFFIVNRHSTKLRLELLEKMNRLVTYEQWQSWAKAVQTADECKGRE